MKSYSSSCDYDCDEHVDSWLAAVLAAVLAAAFKYILKIINQAQNYWHRNGYQKSQCDSYSAIGPFNRRTDGVRSRLSRSSSTDLFSKQSRYSNIKIHQNISISWCEDTQTFNRTKKNASKVGNGPKPVSRTGPLAPIALNAPTKALKRCNSYEFGVSECINLYPEAQLPWELWYLILQRLNTTTTFRMSMTTKKWLKFSFKYQNGAEMPTPSRFPGYHVLNIEKKAAVSKGIKVVMQFQSLRSLTLVGCSNILPQDLERLQLRHSRLEQLCLSGCRSWEPLKVTSYFPRLRSLEIVDSSCVSNRLLLELNDATQLRNLTFRGCSFLSKRPISVFTRSQAHFDKLSMIHCPNIDSSVLEDVATSLPTLRHLEVILMRPLTLASIQPLQMMDKNHLCSVRLRPLSALSPSDLDTITTKIFPPNRVSFNMD